MIITEGIVIGFGSILAFFIVARLSLSKIMSIIKRYQDNIKANLDDAEKIKNQAQELLYKYEEEKKSLLESVDGIIFSAKLAAEDIINRSQKIAIDNIRKKVNIAKKEIDIKGDNILRKLDKNFISTTIKKIKEQMIEDDLAKETEKISQKKVLFYTEQFQKNNSFH